MDQKSAQTLTHLITGTKVGMAIFFHGEEMEETIVAISNLGT